MRMRYEDVSMLCKELKKHFMCISFAFLCFSYVRYYSETEQINALKDSNNFMMGNIKLMVKKGQRKGER